MRAIIIYLTLFCVFTFAFSSYTSPVNAIAGVGREMPGLSCGVGGADKMSWTDADPARCCSYDKSILFRIPSLFEKVPYVGGMISSYNDKASEIEKLETDLKGEPCLVGTPKGVGPACMCIATATSSAATSIRQMCSTYIKSGTELKKCLSCVIEKGGMYTGLGCIPLNVQEFISGYLFSIGIGLAGGISLLCIIYSAFMMQTSMGNPEAIKKAQENLTACITGLILIIFSVFILRLIGVNILNIPFLK